MKARLAALMLAAAGPSQAAGDGLALELNTLQQLDPGCRLVFTIANATGRDVDALVYEVVLFDRDGAVSLLTLFDFRDVPDGRTRVRQFDLPELSCAAIGGFLVNGAATCEGEGLAPAACAEATRTTSRTDVEVLG